MNGPSVWREPHAKTASTAAPFRFTVAATPERHDAIRTAAKRIGLAPQTLVQMLFDRLDLTGGSLDLMAAREAHAALFPPAGKDTREMADAANRLGLTMKELRYLRALVDCAKGGVARPCADAINQATGLPVNIHDDLAASLMVKGWIGENRAAHGGGRRAFSILRRP